MTNSLWPARVPRALAVILLLLLPVVFGAPSPRQHEELQRRDDLPEGYYAPPYYPTPPGGWLDEWSASYAKAAAMVRNMTLAEKVNLTTGSGYEMGRCVGNLPGVPRLGVPVLCLQDGPLGIRSTDNNSAFPAGITTGATFNKDLMYARGVALGEEFRGKGIHVYLGPSVGPLGRKPLGGRNWEGFGADPVLQGYGGSLTVKGVQSQGVIATIKHYVANEQEIMRMQTPVLPIGQPYSSDVDDRTMHELYLWPFAEAVRAGVGAAMASYNAINGSAASQNAYLLNGVLKDELGFQGFVMSDWYGHYTGVASTLAGLDMSMPGEGPLPLFGDSYWAYEMSKAVLNGSVPMDRINDIATRVLASWFQMGQDEDYPDVNFSAWTDADEGQLYPGAGISPTGIVNEHVNVQGNHKQVIRQVATEAITLLKNENNTLPLTTSTPLVVFGDDAQANPDGPNSCSDKGCDKGVLGQGWGSGTANYPYLDAPIDALRRRASNVTAYLTDDFPSDPEVSDGDVALVFINSDSGENYITVEGNPGDRTSDTFYAWHDGDDLVQSAADTYSTVIVIYHTVGPVVMSSWIDLPAVKAVLVAHLPGQEAGDSLTDVLFGDVSPSGHLPYTLPKNATDYPESVSIIESQLTQAQDPYTEGLYIDYRYFVTNNISVQYPFGHGLSYSTFTYTSPSVTTGEALTSTPPARPAKGSTPSYSDAIPAPSEVYYPDDYTYIRGYLYPYLDTLTANAQAALANTSTYPYPQGYSEEAHAVPRAGGAQGGNPALWDVMFTVTVDVTNAASSVQGLAAKSVVQAYVKYPDGNGGFETPTLQLRDFAKTSELAEGDSETVQIELTRKDLSVWSVEIQDWIVPNPEGRYGIYLGESVEDLRVVCWTDGSGCESL